MLTIAVVVDAVPWDLPRVDPQVGGQVGVVQIGARVKDGHDDVGGTLWGREGGLSDEQREAA